MVMLVINALGVETTQDLYTCEFGISCGAGFRSQFEEGWRKPLEFLYLNSSSSPGPIHTNQSCEQSYFHLETLSVFLPASALIFMKKQSRSYHFGGGGSAFHVILSS